MPAPSEKALELSKQCNHICRNYLSRDDADRVNALAIDTALNEARLEGARAMLNAAIEAARSVYSDDAMHAIGNLDPQQVINEGVK
jgi:hypothetical protein